MAHFYICDNPIKEVSNIHVGIDGIARRCRRGWVGIDGVARLFYVDDTVDPTEIWRFGAYYETQSGHYTKTDTHTSSVTGSTTGGEIELITRNTDWIREKDFYEWYEDPTNAPVPTMNLGDLFSLYIDTSSSIVPKSESGRIKITGTAYDYYDNYYYNYISPTVEAIGGKEYFVYRNIYVVSISGFHNGNRVWWARIAKFNSDYIPNKKNMSDPTYLAQGWKVTSISQTFDQSDFAIRPIVSITVQKDTKYDFAWEGDPPPSSLWELNRIERVSESDPTQGAYQVWRKK